MGLGPVLAVAVTGLATGRIDQMERYFVRALFRVFFEFCLHSAVLPMRYVCTAAAASVRNATSVVTAPAHRKARFVEQIVNR